MNTMVFGHRHLGFFFRPLLEVTDSGFSYKGRQYLWSDVLSLKVYDGFYLWFLRNPYAQLRMKDGSSIWLNGRALELQGLEPNVGFFSGTSSAFQQLVGILRSHAA